MYFQYEIGSFRLRSYHQKEKFIQTDNYTETRIICQQIMKIYEDLLSDPRSPEVTQAFQNPPLVTSDHFCSEH